MGTNENQRVETGMSSTHDPRFQKFEILETIKKSECAGVYIARHTDLGRTVLLKTLCTSDKEIVARFKREARLLAQLDHPNIIRVFDFGMQNHELYISFEYIKGSTLRSFLGSQSDLSFKQNATWQIWQGLKTAHCKGIIHRDLKPENILVSDQGIKIADFGLAFQQDDVRVTDGYGIVGTPGYMSPEQIRGEKITTQSDLFSLGIVLYELWTGNHPFLASDVPATLNRILAEQDMPDITDIPEPYASVIHKLLPKKQQKRTEPALPENQDTQQNIRSVKAGSRKIASAAVFSLILAAVILAIFLSSGKREQKPTLKADNQILNMTPSNPEHANPMTGAPDTSAEPIQDISAENEKHIEPQRTPGALSIECYPWADVRIDGKRVDTTPLQNDIKLFPGQYTVQLHHPDFPVITKKIRISPNKRETFHVRLDTVFGYFNSLVHPWANVYIDDRLIGQTPLQNAIPLVPGKHNVRLENPDYNPITDTIEIVQKDTLIYRFNYNRLLSDKTGLP
ncbi:protein kinase [candidate division KSB1 bacterium]|nr:protein kinase [candidate division KSB1 bacterium]